MLRADLFVLRGVQAIAGRRFIPRLARGYSRWGEHSAGWLVLGAGGMVLDRPRRELWLRVVLGSFVAHAAAVLIKRVVRRRRPDAAGVRVLVPTPSDLSFPSAHAASTTAAAFALAPVVGAPTAGAVVGTMAVARVVLGVHYPSDVAAGVALGLAVGAVARRRIGTRGRP